MTGNVNILDPAGPGTGVLLYAVSAVTNMTPTVTGTTGSGTFVRDTSPTIATPQITTSINFNGDTPVGRESAAVVQLGTDAGSATAQTLKALDGSGTDIAGSTINFAGGQSTGTGRGGDVVIKTSPSSSTGASANSYAERYHASAKHVVLTESSATTFATISVAASKSVGGECVIVVNADNGTEFQSTTTRFCFSAVNKAGTVTAAIDTVSTATAVSSGTLANTITAVANGNNVDLKCSSVSSLTQSTLNATWVIQSLSGPGAAAVTAL